MGTTKEQTPVPRRVVEEERRRHARRSCEPLVCEVQAIQQWESTGDVVRARRCKRRVGVGVQQMQMTQNVGKA